jgi:hypothetical protein
VPSVAWSKSIAIIWDEQHRESSVVHVPPIKVPADPPTVPSRRAVWELSSVYPRVFGAAYRFSLDTVAVNRGLKERRGRTLVVRHVEESSAQMPLAVIAWHLSQRLDEPLLVIAASPRLRSEVARTMELLIETGFRLLVDALLHIAGQHRAWALKRLPAGAPGRERAETQLGSLLFDVEGQDALRRYLETLYGPRLGVAATKGRAPSRLLLAP